MQQTGSTLFWERLNDDPAGCDVRSKVYWAKVPGGWLILAEKAYDTSGPSMIFVRHLDTGDWK